MKSLTLLVEQEAYPHTTVLHGYNTSKNLYNKVRCLCIRPSIEREDIGDIKQNAHFCVKFYEKDISRIIDLSSIFENSNAR